MATGYFDYNGGGGDYGGGDYSALQALQQQEEERRRQEEQMRLQQEEEARRQQEEQARAQQQAQQGQTLGDLMKPPAPPSYDPGAPQAGSPGEVGGQAPMPDQPMTLQGNQNGVAGLPPDQKMAPGQAPPEAPRDYTATPLTGAELEAHGGNPHVQGATSYYGGTAFPVGTESPDRQTSEMDLDAFNKDIRHSEIYQQFIHDRGLWAPNGRVVEWDDKDREDWAEILKQNGVVVDGGMKIDDAGNINQKNLLGKRLAKIGIIAGGVGLTIATGGAASPLLATAIGAGTGAATGAIDNGVKGALIGGLVGGAGGYFMGGGRIPGIGGGGSPAASAASAGTTGSTSAGGSFASSNIAGGFSLGGGGGLGTNIATNVGRQVVDQGVKQAAGAGMSSLMPNVITGLTGITTAYMGQRAQSQANKDAAAAQDRASQSSERTINAQMEFEREQRAQDRADQERRWNAEQAFAAKQWDAAEEERLFKRQIFMEDRAARSGSGGGYSGPSGTSEAELRKQRARANLDALLRQGTPGQPNSYVPATMAGPTGRA